MSRARSCFCMPRRMRRNAPSCDFGGWTSWDTAKDENAERSDICAREANEKGFLSLAEQFRGAAAIEKREAPPFYICRHCGDLAHIYGPWMTKGQYAWYYLKNSIIKAMRFTVCIAFIV